MHPIVWQIDCFFAFSFEMVDLVAHARRQFRKVLARSRPTSRSGEWHFLRGGLKILLALPLALSHFGRLKMPLRVICFIAILEMLR
jgi:hypothetical protein